MKGPDHTPLAPLTVDDPAEIGSFRLIGRLGSGGMGVVYFGRDAADHPAALKMVRAEYAADRGYRARFEREVSLAQRVQGRCIAPLLAADTAAERPWLAVAYAAGPTLRSYVAEQAPLQGNDLTAFAAGLAEALAAIHREGIVHRDLKPDNVILSPEGPKVLDFGIAQALDDVSMTHTDMVVGTPGWISPERYDGHRAGPASDIFCWGQLVAYAASGRPPYGVGPIEVLRYRTINEEPDSAEAELPPALHDVVRRALDRSPDDRPTAADAFAAITGQAVDAADSAAHMTRAATRLIDAEWSLPVTDESARFPTGPLRATTARRPITFAGRAVHDPTELARLLAQHPSRAESWLRADGAAKLRDWLDDIGDIAFDRDYLSGIDSSDRAAIASTAFIAAEAADERPTYRGRDASIEGLRELAQGGADERQLLAEIVVNEIPLITAGHRCGHSECGARCARLERIGHQARQVTDSALITAGKTGFRLAPGERDRAVAIAVETIDGGDAANATVQVALRAVPALVLPWWRELLLDAARTRRGGKREDAAAALVAVQLLAPLARSTAAGAWRRLLSPRTWFRPGAPRIIVLSFLFWTVAAFMMVSVYAFAAESISHPLAPEATPQAAALPHLMTLWPVHLVLALALAAAPERMRLGACVFATFLVTLLNFAPFTLGTEGPVLVPAFVRQPLVDGLDAMGSGTELLIFATFILSAVLFFWTFLSLVGPRQVWQPSTPLLPRKGPVARAAVGMLLIALVVWMAVGSLMVVTATFVLGTDTPSAEDAAELRDGFALLSSAVLPVALLVGVLGYAVWGRTGAHVLWMAALGLLLVLDRLEGMSGLPVPAAGEFTSGIVLDNPSRTGWLVLLVVLPGVYVLGCWLSVRLQYRRPHRAPSPPPHVGYPYPHTPTGYAHPASGQPTPPPGYAHPASGQPTPPPGYAHPASGQPTPPPGYAPHAAPGHPPPAYGTPPGYYGPGHPVPPGSTPPPGYPAAGTPPPHPRAAPRGPQNTFPGQPAQGPQPPTRVGPPTRAEPPTPPTRAEPPAPPTPPTRVEPPAEEKPDGPTRVERPESSAPEPSTRADPPASSSSPTSVEPPAPEPPTGARPAPPPDPEPPSRENPPPWPPPDPEGPRRRPDNGSP
ncbi:hypothetical protein F4561_001074 [Lipingzhangella halophila]|uniref:Protein kinase domain-containing protein n=1 Tax=Lipingzhangella halophila TaxID=1783352 RepID=A0A7W7W1Z9_9ACTN|nr:protein kinase [Lipingzhangella halophila]MBB4930254.1 hypothetical protein [Lipingzhangella halophila]